MRHTVSTGWDTASKRDTHHYVRLLHMILTQERDVAS